MVKGSETPDWLKIEKSIKWISSMMENMDSLLDSYTRRKIMHANGKACYIRAFGIASKDKPSRDYIDRYIKILRARGYDVSENNGITTIIYNWGKNHQNPYGLIMKDGYCMCQIVESWKEKLSPTFCQCSEGYIKESFERSMGRKVDVKVLESLKMGGDDCIFRITIKT